uniref:Glutathione S-transferase theta n=1 Tax=Diaphanosoma celebensis TaxID=2184134 RepID=A0A6B7GC78_9CRUS|nr:glutathione S-transferase theta [Diaphanosoma celebensis]
MALKLYVDLMSQPSRAIYLFLKLTKIPFDLKLVKLREGEHFGEEFGKINPFRKVPAIDDNGFVLTESVAILRYLARERKVPDHWYPSDLKKQAKVDEYLEWQHLNTRLFCAMFFRSKFLEPMMFNRPVEEKKVARFQGEMEKCLAQIENIWLENGKKKFIVGEEISVADLLAVCELEQPGSKHTYSCLKQ